MPMDWNCHWEKEYGPLPNVCRVGICLSYYGYLLTDCRVDGSCIDSVVWGDVLLPSRGFEGLRLPRECFAMYFHVS